MGGWTAVVAVKPLQHAKSRLAVAPDARAALARAFALDTVAVALATPAMGAVLVVTDDEQVAADVTSLGAYAMADAPGSGLNAAVRHGVAAASSRGGPWRIAALAGDLPALTVPSFAAVLRRAEAFVSAFVADSSGTGTTLLCAAHPAQLNPAFGAGSAAAHRAGGAIELEAADDVRHDVDTLADLQAAVALGVGPATTRALAATEVLLQRRAG